MLIARARTASRVILAGLTLLAMPAGANQEEALVRSSCGDLLGQAPPGASPEVFAPGIVSTAAWEAAGSFSPDCEEFFFTRRPTAAGTANRVFYMRHDSHRWTAPRLAPFAMDYMEYEPHVAADGSRVYFNSRRPDPDTGRADRKLWYAERTAAGWSEAKPLDPVINRLQPMYVSSTLTGTLYFGAMEGRRYGIFKSELADGSYQVPTYLPPQINGVSGASHPFISPDGRFLVFDAYTAGLGESALFFATRAADGGWEEAVRLGPEINATNTEIAASLSPDGRFLFFHREGDIYWVSTSILVPYGFNASELATSALPIGPAAPCSRPSDRAVRGPGERAPC